MAEGSSSETPSAEDLARLSRLKTEHDALAFAVNARRLGKSALADKAVELAGELKAESEGFRTQAEREIAKALYAYEEAQKELKGRRFRATRTRKMIKDHGAIRAAERMVLNRKLSLGFNGQPELSFEAIIVRFPGEFAPEAVRASRARLDGDAYRPAEPPDQPLAPSATSRLKLDDEAKRLLAEHLSPRNPVRFSWHPRYSETVRTVRAALDAGRPDDVFERIWKAMDNGVVNVRQGVLSGRVAERMRERLAKVTQEIAGDGSPSHFDSVTAQFEAWRDSGDVTFHPRALIGRAFATIHPDRYHTVVNEADQERLLSWFEEHTGLVAPKGSWATRAAALVAHLSQCHVFDGEVEVRNTFPWFVFRQLRDEHGELSFNPGHSPRQRGVEIVREAAVAKLSDRHIAIQDVLYAQLVAIHGKGSVATEHGTGTGGWADVLVRREDGSFDLYELKPSDSASDAVRQALGQLLEYVCWSGGLTNATMHVVSDAPSDPLTEVYLQELDRRFGLRVSYLQVEAH